MDITRNGSTPSVKGPSEYFTGAVRQDARFQAPPPARVGGVIVTFEPCRNAADNADESSATALKHAPAPKRHERPAAGQPPPRAGLAGGFKLPDRAAVDALRGALSRPVAARTLSLGAPP